MICCCITAKTSGVATLDSSRHVPIHKFKKQIYKSMLHFLTGIPM